jgi:hypothetical protein
MVVLRVDCAWKQKWEDTQSDLHVYREARPKVAGEVHGLRALHGAR